jgi:hypothetical protein
VRQARVRSVLGWTWAASIALHVVAISAIGWLALHPAAKTATTEPPHAGGEGTIPIDLPGVAEGTLLADRRPDPTGDPPQPRSGSSEAQLDQSKIGRGGEPTTIARPTNLSDRDELVHLTPDLLDRLDHDQQQRLRTSKARASWEDRRSSREPMELTFLASGDGTRAERRTPRPYDPSRGGARSDAASIRGGLLGDPAQAEGQSDTSVVTGAARDGSEASAPGVGVRDGRAGLDHRLGAHVMRARPDVVLAAVSVPATRRGRPRDDIDSDQEVARTLRSLVHASTAAGAIGEATGGTAGGGDPGADGRSGAGTSAHPVGPGDAEWWDLDTADPRFVGYFRRIHKKLDPLWAHAFPLRAALDFRQGTVIFAVTIAASGDVAIGWPPLRPSGIPEFDRNCYEAIQRGAPFDPIPASLGVRELHVRMPFDAQNPMVK